MKRKSFSGFTLIELLVVIAIIGILAAVVLVAVNSAKIRAKDAVVKSDVTQAKNAADLYFDGDYTNKSMNCGYCQSYSGNPVSELDTIGKMATDIASNGSQLLITSNTTGYSISASLPSTINSSNVQTFSINSSGNTTPTTPKISSYGATPLFNGGFETGSSGSLTPWTPDGSGTATAVNTQDTQPHSGTYSAKLSYNVGMFISSSYNLLTVGKTYKVSYWAKSNTVNPAVTSTFESNWYGGNQVTLNTPGQWQNITYSFVAGSGDSGRFGIYNRTTSGSTIYIDDVTLEELN